MPNLSERSFRVLRAAARALFDCGDGVPEDRLDWALAELRELLAVSGAFARTGLRLALLVLQLAPLLFFGRLRRFTGLPIAERARVLERLESGPLATLFVPIKVYLCMVYFEHPDAALATGVGSPALAPEPERSAG